MKEPQSPQNDWHLSFGEALEWDLSTGWCVNFPRNTGND